VRINLYTTQSGEQETCSVISVRDNGLGIAPEHLPHICTRFYRGDPSRSQIIQGDGLGLAIVKSIMDLHNGRLEIDSTPNQGTEFQLVFIP
jgi:signal transduction histidine kinase